MKRTIDAQDARLCIDWLKDETLPLIRELVSDLKRFYEPEKGWPPHIERALDLGDDEQTVADLEAFIGGRS